MAALLLLLAGCPVVAACQEPAEPLLLGHGALERAAEAGGVAVVHDVGEGVVRLGRGGELVTVYHYRDGHHPYFHPVIGPRGAPMTRGYPMDPQEDEAHDHPHHRSLWFAHGDVNGEDFWHAAERPAVIELTGLVAIHEGAGFTARHAWRAGDGTVLARDTQQFLVFGNGRNRLLCWRLSIRPVGGALRFGDTKEGTMAIRTVPSLRLEGPVAAGAAINSEGVQGKAVWGERAAWVDYSGPVRGPEREETHRLGVAIFDHPENLRHPTWWHARAYGLVAANPFGIHDFDGGDPGRGDFVLAEGEELVLRYAFYLHEGSAADARIPAVYAAWADAAP